MAWPDSDYPGALDSPPDPDATLDGTPLHSELHLWAGDAIEKVQQSLGTNPQGPDSSVAARFGFLDVTRYTAYTPVISGTGWSIGNGSIFGAYEVIGTYVDVLAGIVFGTTSSYGSVQPTLSLPVAPRASAVGVDIEGVTMIDSSDSNRPYVGRARLTSGGFSIQALAAGGTYLSATAVTNVVPFTWAQGDNLRAVLRYQRVT